MFGDLKRSMTTATTRRDDGETASATARRRARPRDGERDSIQLLDTHAFFLDGLIDLYEVTLNPQHLEMAVKIADRMIADDMDRLQPWRLAQPLPRQASAPFDQKSCVRHRLSRLPRMTVAWDDSVPPLPCANATCVPGC